MCNEGYNITGTVDIHDNNIFQDINQIARGTPKIGMTRSRHTKVARKINNTVQGNSIPYIFKKG